jgi:hypothetical protein
MRIGLLSNPHSGRNRRMLGHLQGIVTAAGGIHHEITPDVSDIPLALLRMAQADIEVVAVNGGDGSIALVLGCLLSGDSPFASPPLLCALPGGTTNVTVGDVGIRGGLDTALLRLLAWRNGKLEGRELSRAVIGVRGARGQVLGCGLVFGAGAVVTGIEYWQESVRSRGMRSEYSSGVAMIRTVWGMLRGHERFARPVRMQLQLPGTTPVDADFTLLTVSTLQRLFLGIHPFWGQETGALRITAIERGASPARCRPYLRAEHPCTPMMADTTAQTQKRCCSASTEATRWTGNSISRKKRTPRSVSTRRAMPVSCESDNERIRPTIRGRCPSRRRDRCTAHGAAAAPR